MTKYFSHSVSVADVTVHGDIHLQKMTYPFLSIVLPPVRLCFGVYIRQSLKNRKAIAVWPIALHPPSLVVPHRIW